MTNVGIYEFNAKDLIGHGAFAVVYKGRLKTVRLYLKLGETVFFSIVLFFSVMKWENEPLLPSEENFSEPFSSQLISPATVLGYSPDLPGWWEFIATPAILGFVHLSETMAHHVLASDQIYV